MIGFGDASDDDDGPGQVVDGSSSCDLSPAAMNEAFVSLCSELRAMGCVEVRAGEFRAVWPASGAAVVPRELVRQAVAEQRKRPEREPEPEKVLATDTPDDIERRRRYVEIQEAVGGAGG